jgi:hypothetical protein
LQGTWRLGPQAPDRSTPRALPYHRRRDSGRCREASATKSWCADVYGAKLDGQGDRLPRRAARPSRRVAQGGWHAFRAPGHSADETGLSMHRWTCASQALLERLWPPTERAGCGWGWQSRQTGGALSALRATRSVNTTAKSARPPARLLAAFASGNGSKPHAISADMPTYPPSSFTIPGNCSMDGAVLMLA